MNTYKFDKKQSVEFDFSYSNDEFNKVTTRLNQINNEIRLFKKNSNLSSLKEHLIANEISEIQRLTNYRNTLISKKYVFEKTVIYITVSNFLISGTDTRNSTLLNSKNVFTLSKYDPGASFFLSLEIGSIHKQQGKLLEIADSYEIIQENEILFDIRNIHFQTEQGKDICRSCRELIFGEYIEDSKIKINNIFKYKERIQSPEQNYLYKVIRDNDKKFILVDGQAGSGKSTAAIDALKNSGDVIYTVLNNAKADEISAYFENDIKKEIIKFDQLHELIKKAIGINSLSKNYSKLLSEFKQLFVQILDSRTFVNSTLSSDYIEIFESESNLFLAIRKYIFETIDVEQTIKNIEKKLHSDQRKLFSSSSDLAYKRKMNQVKKIHKFFLSKKAVVGEFQKNIKEITEIYNELLITRIINTNNFVFTGKRSLLNYLSNIALCKRIKSNSKFNKEIDSVFESSQFLETYFFPSKASDIVYLTKQMLGHNNYLNDITKFNQTLMIDEFQELPQNEIIDILCLLYDRIVLVGDRVQTSKQQSYIPFLFPVEEISFTRNFRQTYQLAVASLQIRKKITNQQIEIPLRSDYYRDQIEHNGDEFKTPKISVQFTKNQIVSSLIQIYQEKNLIFDGEFPIIVIYNFDQQSFANAIRIELSNSKYKSTFKNLDDETPSFLFMTVHEIQGKEAPIVVYLDKEIKITDFYISLTRAQFQFYAFVENIPTWIHDYNAYFEIENDHANFEHDEVVNSIPRKVSVKQKQKKSLSDTKKVNDPVKEIKKIIETDNESLTSNDHQSGKKQVVNNNATVDDQLKPVIEPSFASDIKKFKESYLKTRETKLRELAERSKSLSNATKTIVVKEKISKIGADETKDFFRRKDQYAGHCQICGFSFKTKKNQYYCERFTWTDYKKGKWTKAQKELLEHKIIDAGNSLCLCAKCHSVIKQGGDFEAIFLNDIFDSISSLSDDDILQAIQSDKLIEVPDIFRDHIDFNDMYALPIRLLGKNQHLYFTETHLIQFIEFLKS